MADPKIRIKRSAVAGRIPSVDQVPLGELALNTWDGQLYASKNVGLGTTVVAVNPWLVGTGTDSYNSYFTAGNIGIGSTTPTSKLHVVGDAYISGVVTANAGFNLGISSAGSVITSGPIKTLNFIGAGNTFLVNGTTVDISIQGGGGGGGAEIGVQANDSVIGYAQTTLNFVGSGVTGVSIGTTATITIEPGLVGAAKSVTSFTATAGQTTFNVNYSQGQENVFLNGVRLSESQYTATNGSTVVLNDAASDGDSVDIVVYLRGSDPNRNVEVTLLPPFNGITTAFTMYKGSTSYLFDPIDERQIVVSLGGVIQQPGVAYTVGTGSSIFFSAAPGAATTCFITALYSNTVGVPTDAVKLNKQTYTPSGIQTTFTVTEGYSSGYLDVYRNGIRLVDGSDFTASNGTTFDLVTPATGGDVVDVIAYQTLNIAYAEFAGLSTNVDGGYGSLTNLQVSGISTFASDLDINASVDVQNNVVIGGNLNASGISTLGNVYIGIGGTDLLVEGNARVTGILTVGPGSITFDGINNKITGITETQSTNTLITGIATFSNGPVVIGQGSTDTSIPLQVIGSNGSIQVRGEVNSIGSTSLLLDCVSGQARVMATGPDATTKGTLTFITMSSNATQYVEAMRITKDSYIGIGNTDPDKPFVLKKANPGNYIAEISNTQNSPNANGLYVNTTDTNATTQPLNVQGSLIVTGDGNIGIGTDNPTQKLIVDQGTIWIRNRRDPSLSLVSESPSGGYVQRAAIYADHDHTGASNTKGTLKFFVNDGTTGFVERMTIQNDGNTGIGTTNPRAKFQVAAGPTNSFSAMFGNPDDRGIGDYQRGFGTARPIVIIGNDNDGTDGSHGVLCLYNGDTSYGTDKNLGILEFGAPENGKVDPNASLKAYIACKSTGSGGATAGYGGDIAFHVKSDNSGSLPAERFRVTPNGVTFNGDTAAANALDDYEEGSWTPVLNNGGTMGVTAASYTKVGRLVTAYTYLTTVAPTNNGSQFQIGGLPYTSLGGNTFMGGSILYTNSGNLSGWAPLVWTNSTYIYFHIISGSGVIRTNSDYVAVSNNQNLILQVTYAIA